MKKETKEPEFMATMKPITEQIVLEETPYDPSEDKPSKLEHFEIYNKWARKNKRPILVPTEEYYPKAKVRFQRFEQPTNVLKCRVRNKDIDFTGQLIPGCVYELCIPVIKWLTSLSEPIFAEVKIQNDTGNGRFIEKTETRQVGEKARFSCQPMEYTGY